MDVDEDDDFYAPEENMPSGNDHVEQKLPQSTLKSEEHDEDLEEGEEEDEEGEEDDDSDIDIITERKDGTTAAAPSQARYNEIRNIGQRTASSDAVVRPAAVKKESGSKGSVSLSGADLPAVATSKIDINAKPVYEPAGKPITQLDIDEDLPENDKPWRRPGTDISDYFNYGFDEFTWALYASKQESLRSEYNQDKVAQNNKKMFEDMNMMMAMGGMAGMPGIPTGPAAGPGGMGMPAMPGMEGIPPEMQAMMQQMMSQGIDPTQMDPAAMFASMAAGAAGGAAAGGQGQGFGNQQNFGQAQNQQQGYGYETNLGNRGNFRGRGRGHRNW